MTQAPTEQIPAEHLLAAHTQREVELAQQAFDLGQQLTDARARVSALTALVEELKAQITQMQTDTPDPAAEPDVHDPQPGKARRR